MSLPPTQQSLYLRLLSFVKPYWKQFAASLLAMALFAAAETAVAALFKPLLDGSFVDKDPLYMFWMPFVILGVFAVRGISNLVSVMAITWVGTKMVLDLRNHMFHQLLVLPAGFYDNHATGNLISKLSYDVTMVTDAATNAITVLVKDSLTVVFLLGWMFYLNWQLSLTTFTILPLMMLVVRITGKRMRRLNRSLQTSMGDMTHVLEESIKGHKIVKIFGGQQYESERFHDVANWVRRFQMKIKAAAMVNVTLVEGFGAVCFALIIYVGTGQAAADAISVGGFVSFFTAMGLLFSPIKRLTKVNESLQRGLAASESIFDLLDESPEVDHGKTELPQVKGHVQFQSVSLQFPHAERAALDQVSFEIKPGQTIALVGPSGSGKTSLASLLARFYPTEAGKILIDGIDINDISLQSLRQQLSYVGQDVVLFNDTVSANIAYGMEPKPSLDDIKRAANQAYVTEFAEQLPDGFDTFIGENGARLSGGQRQRIAIARAFIKNAPLLILDEATSALDTASERHVQQAIEALEANTTTLVIAHRLSTVENADLILVIDQGHVIEQGTHQQLLQQGGAYAELYNTQFSQH
ncbi:MAG: lipid A export permease/ATP-binding protein MsbA [Chromatiales bacterium]|jgi:subfamily B ATP-binding cassette protein MsbA